MKRKIVHPAVFLLCLVAVCHLIPFCALSQKINVLQYVNPFIGTAKSNEYTKWGNEGGTYPGAVAPWGAVQLTPETRGSGYDYKDSSIRFFSCLQHHSGYPGGSAGSLHIMPVLGKGRENESRFFLHRNEQAEPGYYKVSFNDNNTIAEATATTHAGLFKFTFPVHIVPYIFISDAGGWSMQSSHVLQGNKMNTNTVIHSDQAINSMQKEKDGYLLFFTAPDTGRTIIYIQISASSVDYESAQQNIEAELAHHSFEEIRETTAQSWEKELSLVSISDSSANNKTIFYTALYHSLLLPWMISGVNGKYKGADEQIHTAKGKNEYGGFSPWDTFRSLHPLLSLLYPDRQKDMILSMLDIYQQSGYLPVESMTGNHSIPILVDSYLKGIQPVDSSWLYEAMKKSIVNGPFIQPDMALYQQGFIPYPHTESVTRTVEYAYDDWALAQYAKLVMNDDGLFSLLMKRSRNYRNLFDANELSLLPRKDSLLYHGTANAGYKEGDQWVYTLFLPQYQRDLINLMGGDENFVDNIDKEFADNRLVFDNETMFHVPYLFNSTAYPYKTQQWINAIRKRFSAAPGGLPGNDDLGATSSWFVWSALGIYPVCPGNPVYATGAPLFKEVTLIFHNGKQLQIKANHLSPDHFYVKQTELNGNIYNDKWLSHQAILKGGELAFDMTNIAASSLKNGIMPNETDSASHIMITDAFVSKKTALPDEPFWITYTISNSGGSGTAVIKLHINDSTTLTTNSFVQHGETRRDSIPCRLYASGNNTIRLDNLPPVVITVLQSSKNNLPFISNLHVSPFVKQGGLLHDNYTITNKGGDRKTFVILVRMNDKILRYDTVMLRAGDSIVVSHSTAVFDNGLYNISVASEAAMSKVYSQATDALVLNIPEEVMGKKIVKDKSGFSNNGQQSAFGNYIQLPHTPSLDSNGTTLTMMAWIYDTGTTKPYTELIAKGDNHVFQLADGKSLTFFAGGWGRGDCTVPLPGNWRNHWHHIAGVCNGKDLRVYIDGKRQGITSLEEMINLNVAARWTIGNNEEFPLDRLFRGKIKGIKIYAAPLSALEVQTIYTKEKQSMVKE